MHVAKLSGVKLALILLIALVFSGAYTMAQTLRLDIVLNSNGTTSPLIHWNDEVLLYSWNGTQWQSTVMQPWATGGYIVPVFYDVDSTMQMFLLSGQTFHWVQPNGQEYTQEVTFSSINPCYTIVAGQLTQLSPCSIKAGSGAFEYNVNGNDPRIVVHTSTGSPS